MIAVTLTRFAALTAVLLCGLLAAPAAQAVDPEVEPNEISGAEAMLERGLPADNPPLFALRAPAQSQSGETQPDDYGVDDRDFQAIFGSVFTTAHSDSQWATTTGGALYCKSGATYGYFDAQFHIPIGARTDGIRTWTYDTNGTENMHLFFWQECQPSFGAGEPVVTELINDAI